MVYGGKQLQRVSDSLMELASRWSYLLTGVISLAHNNCELTDIIVRTVTFYSCNCGSQFVRTTHSQAKILRQCLMGNLSRVVFLLQQYYFIVLRGHNSFIISLLFSFRFEFY